MNVIISSHEPAHRGRMLWLAVTVGLVVQIPALRAVFKFLPHPTAWSVLLITGGIGVSYLLLVRPVGILERLLAARSLPGFVFLILSAINFIIYPIVDGRKAQGLGSTGDDAMIEPVKALLSGHSLYSPQLYDGAPISPGPGWILLNAPLTAVGLYFLITPTYLAATTLLFRRWEMGNIRSSAALLLILSSPIIWELMVNGHDLVALGCMLSLLPLFCFHYGRRTDWRLVVVALLAGLVASARVVLVPLPLLLALFVWKSNRAGAVWVGALGSILVIGIHMCSYFLEISYPPLHLLQRGHAHVGLPLMILGGSATLLFGYLAFARYQPRFDSVMLWYSGCLLLPFACIAFGEFLAVARDFARWEGANYLVPVIPSIVFSASALTDSPLDGPAKDTSSTGSACVSVL